MDKHYESPNVEVHCIDIEEIICTSPGTETIDEIPGQW